MVISRQQWDRLVEHAKAAFPNEACGMVALDAGTVVRFYPMTNVDESPVHFRMDPNEQLKAELEIEDTDEQLGIFHSHTRTRAYPSTTDIGLAQHPGALYLIVSLADVCRPDLRAFSIEDGHVTEESVEFR